MYQNVLPTPSLNIIDSTSVPGAGVQASALAAIRAALTKVLINASPE
jgi:hypothetical protein